MLAQIISTATNFLRFCFYFLQTELIITAEYKNIQVTRAGRFKPKKLSLTRNERVKDLSSISLKCIHTISWEKSEA